MNKGVIITALVFEVVTSGAGFSQTQMRKYMLIDGRGIPYPNFHTLSVKIKLDGEYEGIRSLQSRFDTIFIGNHFKLVYEF